MAGRPTTRFVFSWPNHRIAVMGPEQLAGVLSIVRRQAAERAGQPFNEAEDAMVKQMVQGQIEKESYAFATARIWDDGIIDPRDTHAGICPRRFTERGPVTTRYGVFRCEEPIARGASGVDVGDFEAAFEKVPVANPRRSRGGDACARDGDRERAVTRCGRRGAARRRADEAMDGPAPTRVVSRDRPIVEAACPSAPTRFTPAGVLAENADFAERCTEADSSSSAAGPGDPQDGEQDRGQGDQAAAGAGDPWSPCARRRSPPRRAWRPVLIKASAGGGGRGMRIARDEAALAEALPAARREAASAFADDTLLLERYFEAPRHIEVQILGDAKGRVIHLCERECSVQRRYQKIIEEAPSTAVDGELRLRLGAAAVAAGEAIGYQGAGTVEFVVDQAGDFYFLEVNTRLQVEHPVTEAVTGLDLVRLQVRSRGRRSRSRSRMSRSTGTPSSSPLAEDPGATSFPDRNGRLWSSDAPRSSLRQRDRGRDVVGPHYDPLLAKIIAHGATRDGAIRRLVRGLRDLGVAASSPIASS
jgi:biotin carboxylase